MTWILTALSLLGALLVAYKRREGFACWIVSNIGWSAVAIARQDWPQLVLWSAYLVTAGIGWVKWGKP